MLETITEKYVANTTPRTASVETVKVLRIVRYA
jgi:hypothetical protein